MAKMMSLAFSGSNSLLEESHLKPALENNVHRALFSLLQVF